MKSEFFTWMKSGQREADGLMPCVVVHWTLSGEKQTHMWIYNGRGSAKDVEEVTNIDTGVSVIRMETAINWAGPMKEITRHIDDEIIDPSW